MKDLTLMAVAVLAAVSILIIALSLIKNKRKKNYKRKLDMLDIEKNKIASTPIIPELAKIENCLENEKIEVMYNEWNKRLSDIKENQVAKITDMLLEAEYTLSHTDYKTTLYKIAKLEMEVYKARTNAEFLLEEVREITTSKEKSRKVITSYKQQYRKLFETFNDSRNDFGDVGEIIEFQFKNIAKKFEEYEQILEKNQYELINETIEHIDTNLKHMEILLDEMPQIILMSTKIIPLKIEDAKNEYKELLKNGFVLDYLNVEENIKEANKKIKEIDNKSKKLDLKDSILELKVLLNYFENLFDDFEKEKMNKKIFDEKINLFDIKLKKTNKIVADIFNKIDSIKTNYNLQDDDLDFLKRTKEELVKLNDDYKSLQENTNSKTFSYSHITNEIEILLARLKVVEESLSSTIDTIGSMKQDETRAREKYNEITKILVNSRNLLREYPIPLIPKSYFTELKEATAAIEEINIELDKSPIDIDTLNIRVETACDLVYKLNNKTKETIKSAAFAEMSIVYGNRYRSNYIELDNAFLVAESLFFKGEYKECLKLTISALNKIEPGIYNKLQEYYTK